MKKQKSAFIGWTNTRRVVIGATEDRYDKNVPVTKVYLTRWHALVAVGQILAAIVHTTIDSIVHRGES